MEQTTYRMRLKAYVGTCLNSNDQELTVEIGEGRTLKIMSDEFNKPPLSQANWLVFESGGFKTKEEGQEYGELLRQALHLAGLCCRVGLNARDAKDGRQLTHIGKEFFSEIYPDSHLLPDFHGIKIIPENKNWVEPFQIRANLKGGRSINNFISVLNEIISQSSKSVSGLDSIQRAIRVMNLADASSDPIAKLVLSVSTVEALAKEPRWTDEQKNIIKQTVKLIRHNYDNDDDAERVINAINGLCSRVPIRQRVKHLLNSIGLCDLFPKWDEIYEARSRLFHGQSVNSGQSSYVEESELRNLGEDAFRLCTQIILTIANQKGMVIPQLATTSFNVKFT